MKPALRLVQSITPDTCSAGYADGHDDGYRDGKKAGDERKFWQGMFTCALLIAAILITTACADLPAADGWHSTLEHQPLLAQFATPLAVDEIPLICGKELHKTVHGCAVRDYAAGVCWIYAEKNPPSWLDRHERHHCEGYDHD